MATKRKYKRYKKYNRSFRKNEGRRSAGVFIAAIVFLLCTASYQRVFDFLRHFHASLISGIGQLRPLLLTLGFAVCGVALCALLFFSVTGKNVLNKAGYFFHPFYGYQHRRIAARHLGRKLRWNEDVHHINGRTSDNDAENLCVLDRKDHQAFHAWLSGERKRRGCYPGIGEQIDALHRFDGKMFF